MKAITYTEYGAPGTVLKLTDVAKPVPEDGEVVVKVRAASVNALDRHFMRGTPFLARVMMGWRKPRITVSGSSYPLSEVPDALRYMEEGHVRGKIIIRVGT